MLIPMMLLIAQAAAPQPAPGPRLPGPASWIPFSAELEITHPSRPTGYGRHVQDEHGCLRRETIAPDGSLMISINNFQTETTYRLYQGAWTAQKMRLIPGLARRPPTNRAVVRKVQHIEGFEAWLSTAPVKSPRGDYVRESTIIPSLNFFEALQTLPGGERLKAQNIRLGSPDHAEFLPPPGVVAAELPGIGGFMQLNAVVAAITFPDAPLVELTTTEEKPVDVITPAKRRLQIVTRVVDEAENLVRVRVYENAVSGRVGEVHGDLLDEVVVRMGASAETSRLVENFAIRITRIRDRRAR